MFFLICRRNTERLDDAIYKRIPDRCLILLTGRDGGKAKPLADICLIASGESPSAIQELHMVLYHSLCQS